MGTRELWSQKFIQAYYESDSTYVSRDNPNIQMACRHGP